MHAGIISSLIRIIEYIRQLLLSVTFLLMLACNINGQEKGIYINEILTSNISSDFDQGTNDYPDWIELHNSGTAVRSLGGYYLTNDPGNKKMWKIPPGAEVAPGGFISFWADESDIAGHTNFNLNKEKGFIGLFNELGAVADSFSYGFQVSDVSFGRTGTGGEILGYFYGPTKDAVNSLSYYSSISGRPEFSLSGGIYNDNQEVALNTESNTAAIYYTINGEEPDSLSSKYSSPLILAKTTALRARVIEKGKIPGIVVTQTYLINEEIHLPVISIVTDSANFFDDRTGIYVTGTNGRKGSCDTTKRNLNQDWERPVNVELYELNGEAAINQEAGIKIYGGCSRTRFPQKSLALYARNRYGKGTFDYQLFPDKKIYEFNSFVLRSSADDQVRTFVRDALAQYTGIGMLDLDFQAYRPAVVFFNGNYWGIHDIREKISEHYLESNFNIDKASVNILQSNYSIVYGSSTEYSGLISFIGSGTLLNKANYNFVKSQIDIDQFIDYEILHIYLAEKDWPGNNIKYWNSSETNFRRWRWICFDLDQTFIRTNANTLEDATAINGPSWPNPPWSTMLLRNLLDNQEFRNRFIQRYALYISTIFKPEILEKKALEFKAVLEPEIPRHTLKWGGKLDPDFHENWTISPTFSSPEQWLKNYEAIISFIKQRPDYAINHLKNKFALKGMAQLKMKENIPGAGSVYVYDRKIPLPEFTGNFFIEIPVLVRAVPNPGYRFLQWDYKGSITGNVPAAETNISITGSGEITAIFEKLENTEPVIVISEINYNSAPESEARDWTELYNRQEAPVDLSGWKLRDSNDENEYSLPNGSVIPANGYLVICQNAKSLVSQYKNLINYRGNTGFGFKNGGEVIRLYDDELKLKDSVRYDNKDPWPELPDGQGYTLALRSTELDNDLAENWISLQNGTPGTVNNLTTVITKEMQEYNFQNTICRNYPNPATSSTNIEYRISVPGNISIVLKDINGKVVLIPVNRYQAEGCYNFSLNTQNLPAGLYLCSLSTDGKQHGAIRIVVTH